MTSVDLAVLAVMFVSGLLAFSRGLVREVLSIGAWVGAAVIAITFLPAIRPLAGPYMPSPEWTDPAGYIVLFLVSLIVLSLIAKTIGGAVRSLGDRRHRSHVGTGVRPGARRGAGGRRVYRRLHGDPARTLARAGP